MMKTKVKNLVYIIIIVFLCTGKSNAQTNLFDIKEYDFISYEENRFLINENREIENFFNKLDKLILSGKGKINIVHIGDSHIQADYISGQMRKYFQNMAWGLNGGRGFIFPVKIARSNNPWNFSVKYRGNWLSCKNVEKKRKCPLGLSGYLVSTRHSGAEIEIEFKENDYPNYYYTSLKVYHNMDTANWKILPFNCGEKYNIKHYPDSLFSRIEFNKSKEKIKLRFVNKTGKGEFVLRGISADNDEAGIVYHSVGVNGAEVKSWLRCPYFTKELQSLHPDLVIISLGTNDSYSKDFNEQDFKRNSLDLYKKIRNNVPEAAVLWATPGDNYRYKKYINYSTKKAEEIIMELGGKNNFIVWNFYDVMGELNAIMDWYKAGLTAGDRLHFNKKGYVLQAELMFNAFLKSYKKHLTNN